MKITKPAKAVLGVVTLAAPIVFLVFARMGYANISGAIRWQIQPTLQFRQLLFAYMVWCGVMVAGYLVHAWKTVPDEDRRFWVVALVCLNIFVAPVYWYRFVWEPGVD